MSNKKEFAINIITLTLSYGQKTSNCLTNAMEERFQIDLPFEFQNTNDHAAVLHDMLDQAIANAQIEYDRYANDGVKP